MVMIVHHFIGFVLCLPGIFGWINFRIAKALVTFAGNAQIGHNLLEYNCALIRYVF